MATNQGPATSQKERDAGQPDSRQDLPRPPRQQQPGHDHQARQDDADQALGEHAERGEDIAEEQRLAPFGRAGPAARRARTPGWLAPMQPATSMSRLANCAPMKKSGCVTSTSKPAGQPRAAAQRGANSVQRARSHGGAEPGRDARRPFARARTPQRRRRDPVEQRRLVEVRQAVQRRRQPVARAQHLPGHADVAPFVGQPAAEPGRGGQPQAAISKRPDCQRSGRAGPPVAARLRPVPGRVTLDDVERPCLHFLEDAARHTRRGCPARSSGRRGSTAGRPRWWSSRTPSCPYRK